VNDVVIRGAKVIDGTEPLNARMADVHLSAGRIVAAAGQVEAPHGADVLDAQGLTIVPGLIDCHVHLVLDADASGTLDAREPVAAIALRAADNARRALAAGITTLRDLGGCRGVEFALRDAIEQRRLNGPRLVVAGRIIAITSSVSDALPGMFCEADGVEALRIAARAQLKAGADVLKVMASGAVMGRGQDPGAAHFEVDELAAVVREAAREGRRVAAHSHGVASTQNALAAGISSIEHGTFLADDPPTLERMAEQGVVLVPTLSFLRRMVDHAAEGDLPPFMLASALAAAERHADAFRCAMELGVPLAFGTDSGSPYCFHGENLRELELWCDLGLAPARALAAATVDAARCLGLEDEIGTLEPGKAADLVIVDGDPLSDIASLRRVRGVIRGGELVSGRLAAAHEVVA
jgi:imidazolonepropionase-like amidohydrolase